MAVDVAPEIVVHRPRAAVAEYMFDPAHEAEWTTGVVESRAARPGRFVHGGRVERVSKFLGRQFGYTYEVVSIDDDRSVELSVAQPFPMRIRYELEDLGEDTLVRIHARGDASGFFRLASPLLNIMVRHNIAKDLVLLKRKLEGASGPLTATLDAK